MNANQVIKNISGGGTIDLGTAGLTKNNNAANAFSGLSEGAAGSLIKTRAGNLT